MILVLTLNLVKSGFQERRLGKCWLLRGVVWAIRAKTPEILRGKLHPELRRLPFAQMALQTEIQCRKSKGVRKHLLSKKALLSFQNVFRRKEPLRSVRKPSKNPIFFLRRFRNPPPFYAPPLCASPVKCFRIIPPLKNITYIKYWGN